MERTCKHNRKYNVDTNLIGKAGEYRVSSELILRNHIIYTPSVDNGIDIIIDDNIKIQIKCGQKQPREDKKHNFIYKIYSFSFRSSKYADRYTSKPHKLGGVDFVILWAIDDDEFYIIPANKIRGKSGISFTADEDKRTQVKWNEWLPYRNAWGLLNGEKVEDNKPTEELECKQCGYKWLPLTPNPSRCPNCNGRWNQVMYDHSCKRCGSTWHSKLEKPIWCPCCHSRIWDKEKIPNNREKITCVQCDYTWQPEVDKPERCPKCHRQRYSEIFHLTCKQCGHTWKSSKGIPVVCPECHSQKWNREKELVKIV